VIGPVHFCVSKGGGLGQRDFKKNWNFGLEGEFIKMFYPVLNGFFHLFHVLVISFTLSGWIFPQTRCAHLILVLATLGSWFILGRWLGEGYCPVTDLHWRIKDSFGEGRPKGTYIYLLVRRVTGQKPSSESVDRAVVYTTFFLLIVSLFFNIKNGLFG
jgi:hypothetical protein